MTQGLTFADYLTILNILVACVGVLFVVTTIYEWKTLRAIRKDFPALEKRIMAENYRAMKAAHRVISSYQIADTDARIALLQSALAEYPAAFNGYNGLGYAYLAQGEKAKALDAFHNAIIQHPKDKAGYFDLAYAYLESGQSDLAIEYLKKAIKVDPSSKQDIATDKRFAEIAGNVGQ